MHHYLIYYLCKFLRILVFGYPAYNIVINSSMSSHTSNICVTLLSSQSATSTGICIIISEPSFDTTKKNTIGHTDVFCIGTVLPGHAMNII